MRNAERFCCSPAGIERERRRGGFFLRPKKNISCGRWPSEGPASCSANQSRMRDELQRRLLDALGPDAVKTAPEDLIAADGGAPVVPRGAGTGLCGGAVPARGGVVLSFACMNRILELDVANRRA